MVFYFVRHLVTWFWHYRIIQCIIIVIIIIFFYLYYYYYCVPPVIESHPDNALEDLRLDRPFSELTDHIQSYQLDSMDKKVCVWVCVCLCPLRLCLCLGVCVYVCVFGGLVCIVCI